MGKVLNMQNAAFCPNYFFGYGLSMLDVTPYGSRVYPEGAVPSYLITVRRAYGGSLGDMLNMFW